MFSFSLMSVSLLSHRQSCPTLCDPIDGSPPGSCPWDSPGKNTGVGCHFLLQGIFPIQGSNPGLSQCRQSLYHLHSGYMFVYFTFSERFFLILFLFFSLIFGCAGSSLPHVRFLWFRRARASLLCGAWVCRRAGLSCCGEWALGAQASVVVVLSCPEACGIFPDQTHHTPRYRRILYHGATRDVPHPAVTHSPA